MNAGGSDASSSGEVAETSSESASRGEAAIPAGSTGGRGTADLGPSRPRSGRTITDLELSFAQNPSSDVYVELTHAYLEKRRFMEAMVVCKKAVRNRPDELRPKIMLARVHEAQERHPRALEVLEGLVAEAPDDPEVRLALGRVRIGSGQEEAGIADLKLALDQDPSLSEASALLEQRGITYPPPPPPPAEAPPPSTADLHLPLDGMPVPPGVDPNLANVSLAHTLPPSGALPPGTSASGIYRMRPQMLEGEDELERMAAAVAEEQAKEPSRGRAKTTVLLLAVLLVGTIGFMTHRWFEKRRIEAVQQLSERAVEAFDEDLYASYKRSADALETILADYDADHPRTRARLAHVYAILLTEHLEQSVASRLKEVLALAESAAPEDPHTLSARGLSVMREGDDHLAAARTAADQLEPAAAKDQQTLLTFVDLTLGIAELEMGDVEPAHRRLREVAEFMGSNVRAQVWAARASAGAGRLGTAERYYMKAEQREPRHPGAIAGRALVNVVRGRLAAAAQALEQFGRLESEGSRDISPKDRATAVFAQSELLRRKGQEESADLNYERATKLDPANTDFPFQRGKGLLERDMLDQAIEYLGQAVEQAPSRWTYRIELAEALMLAKKYDEAKVHLDKALEKAPRQLWVQLTRARFLRRTDSQETEAFLTKDLAERFPNASVELGLELGRYLRDKGRLTEAREALSKAVEASGGRPQSLQGDVYVTFGLVLQDQKQQAAANAAFREAAKRGALDGIALLALNLQTGNSAERAEAADWAHKYLEAGDNLRRSELMRRVLANLGG